MQKRKHLKPLIQKVNPIIPKIPARRQEHGMERIQDELQSMAKEKE